MNRLKLSTVKSPQILGDENFFARKALAKDFDGLMDPILGIEHFELTSNVFLTHPNKGTSSINYIFENSAPYYSFDYQGNKKVITPGSMLWKFPDKDAIDKEFPNPEGAIVEGIQLFLNSSFQQNNNHQSLFMKSNEMPEINNEGIRIKVVCGKTGNTVNKTKTPNPLTILHIFLDKGKEFKHILPSKWSGTIMVIEGRLDFSTIEETTELEEGMVLSMADSDYNELLTLTGITPCELILVESIPLFEGNISHVKMSWNPLAL